MEEVGHPLEEINQRLESQFAGGEMETLAGFVLHEFGELPTEGESIEISDFRFTVKKITRNRIAKLHMESLSLTEIEDDPEFVAEPEADSVPEPGSDSEPKAESGSTPQESPAGESEEVKKGDN